MIKRIKKTRTGGESISLYIRRTALRCSFSLSREGLLSFPLSLSLFSNFPWAIFRFASFRRFSIRAVCCSAVCTRRFTELFMSLIAARLSLTFFAQHQRLICSRAVKVYVQCSARALFCRKRNFASDAPMIFYSWLFFMRFSRAVWQSLGENGRRIYIYMVFFFIISAAGTS